MSYSTQITILTGINRGPRKLKSFVLGNECTAHRDIVRALLPLAALDEIEGDDVREAVEIPTEDFDDAVSSARSILDNVEAEGLRSDIAEMAKHWIQNGDLKDSVVFAELV